jgi:hypothetical protein
MARIGMGVGVPTTRPGCQRNEGRRKDSQDDDDDSLYAPPPG